MAERIFAALSDADCDLAVSAAGTDSAHPAKHPGRSAKTLHICLRTHRFENDRPCAAPGGTDRGDPRVRGGRETGPERLDVLPPCTR